MATKAPSKPHLHIPAPGSDSRGLGRVGIIAALCFLIGVAWPKLAGVKLVPSVPESKAPTAAPTGSEDGAEPQEAEPAAVAAAATTALTHPTRPPSRIKLGTPQVTSCRGATGEKLTSCSAPALQPAFEATLLGLEQCEAGKDAVGMLSLGVELDFGSNQVAEVSRGRSTTLSEVASQGLLRCFKSAVTAVDLSSIKHEQQRYTVFFPVELLATPTSVDDAPPPSDGEGELTPASGVATVSWDVAVVRAAPKDGDIQARILKGTRVTVTGKRLDWYRIKYDAKGSEGWVYKSAIGM